MPNWVMGGPKDGNLVTAVASGCLSRVQGGIGSPKVNEALGDIRNSGPGAHRVVGDADPVLGLEGLRPFRFERGDQSRPGCHAEGRVESLASEMVRKERPGSEALTACGFPFIRALE